MVNQPSAAVNPLASFMRQPKIYIKLPSNGQFWAPGSLIISETGDYPVYSMTAKDELMLKVPDALITGQAVVDVIQHCIPNIKNAWEIPSIDLDVILISIRLATYGEKMVSPIKLGDQEVDYAVDLRQVMDTLLSSITWDTAVPINNDITVFVKPLNYKTISEGAVKTFETQKIIDAVNNENISEADKVSIFKESFQKLTAVTIGVVQSSIFRIDTPIGSTEDLTHIKEFIDNADKEVFDKVQKHLDKLREINSIKPIRIAVTDELKEQGYTEDFIEIPLVFDPSTFFA
jgi:hypothetical protein